MEENKNTTVEEVVEETVAPEEAAVAEEVVVEATDAPKEEGEKEAPRRGGNRNNRNGRGQGGKGFRRPRQQEEKEFEERVVKINRVTKVVKGGRRYRFAALVVIGDKKGRVGFGTGKANEVPDAIKKATEDARHNLVRIPLVGTTLPHEIVGNYGAGSVLLRPATEGTGVIAGGPVRAVMELAGVNDVLTKCLGSRTPINMIRATFAGLKQMKTLEEVTKTRGMKASEVRRQEGSTMKLNEMKYTPGSRHDTKRLGRGRGSGLGKTSGKGHKGQNARSGGGVRLGFEGGQTTLARRLPKRGFTNHSAIRYQEVSLKMLEQFDDGATVDLQALIDAKAISKQTKNIKVLGGGELTKKLTVKANKFTAGAKEAIEKVGGKAEVIQDVS